MREKRLDKQVNVRVTPELWRLVHEKSRQTGIRVTTFVRAALNAWVSDEGSPFVQSVSSRIHQTQEDPDESETSSD